MKYCTTTALLIFFTLVSVAQYMNAESKYFGLKPRTDYNPYVKSTGTNINILPLVFEYRLQDYKGAQIRPILDLQFGGTKTQLSNMGLAGAYNLYFNDAIQRDFFIKPTLAAALTYTHNRLNKSHVASLAIEPGISFLVNPNFLISVGANPSLSYFIGKTSRTISGSSTGIEAGWGLFIHLGYNMFSVMY
ncbi:hypothetical protein N9R81_03440 [Flavobacteriales bacterium]|nr:hypothetical protein [Flavobacteriales bacterium]